MKVIVLGAGVIGVTTAYYLARQGHEVVVVDRQAGPAMETSFANAGEVSPGCASPWAAPGIPLKALRWLFMRHAPLRMTPTADPFQYSWMLQMLANCTNRRYAINKGRMVRLAEYSREVLADLRKETGIAYDEQMQGTLQLFRSQKQLDHAAGDIAILEQYGVRYELLDRAGCVAAEPGLASMQDKIVGGLRLPGDETGDCYLFTRKLTEKARQLGVTFLFDRNIDGLEKDGDKVSAVRTSLGSLSADKYVLALGSYSRHFARQLDMNLPVYPVKGYSITLPIIDSTKAPVSTVLDETYKIAITRLGDRIRVGGMAELSGYNNKLPPARMQTLLHVVTDLYEGAGDVTQQNFWSGLRPMTPDSTPIVGKCRYTNLFLNTGHGTMGWTMCCGSAKIAADLLSGLKPEIDTIDLGPSRYRLARAGAGTKAQAVPVPQCSASAESHSEQDLLR